MKKNDKQFWVQPDGTKIPVKTTGNKSASVTGSAALPLDETWEIFLAWVADYCGDEETAKAASYTREDMRHAFAAGCAQERGEQQNNDYTALWVDNIDKKEVKKT